MIFYSSSLLSKWGNNDGDILDEFLDDYCEENNIECDTIDCHKLIKILIEKYVLPKIRPKIEIEFIGTIHNPVRAKTINGLDCTHLWYNSPNEHIGLLNPEEIEIPNDLILSEFKTMRKDMIES